MVQTLTVECTVSIYGDYCYYLLMIIGASLTVTSIKKKNNDVRYTHLCTKIIIFTLYYRATVMYLLGDGK